MAILGINGMGRIGKLTFWNQLSLDMFEGYVLNAGREIGNGIGDFVDFIKTDSTYGNLSRFLYGYSGKECDIRVIDADNWKLEINGRPVQILTTARNPKDIGWGNYGVKTVVDCTGVFLDPNEPADAPKGSVRGHLASGAETVICSAPFKIGKGQDIPEDAKMVVFGINHKDVEMGKHRILSAASCTTTGLSHMMKPLIDNDKIGNILTVCMSTIHAATNNQMVLDGVPGKGAKDLRRNRSVMNNIIITSTGAAKALKVVLPQLKDVPFMADSIRVPTNTVSLISLTLTMEKAVTAEDLNDIYRHAAQNGQRALLHYSEKQSVSCDYRGERASVIIEGVETVAEVSEGPTPITHAKIMGWYDNEFGNYVNSLSNLLAHVTQ
ncbi:MAG: glyceraldehyde-3-phosphate dehydrogenase [Clostridia bacterium]|nr:glyceraldehyde-3-phosphate dehydrogenase [Clostridia bacterium]